MATFWVSTAGDDSDGTTLAKAKNSLEDGLALLESGGIGGAQGDILNVVNDGTYIWPTSAATFTTGAGSSFTTFGFKIRGVDASENPAKVTVAPSGAVGSRHMFSINSGAGYVIVENLIFDATGATYLADSNPYRVSSSITTGNPGPVRYQYCEMLGGPTGTMSGGDRSFYDNISTNGGGVEFLYCYWQNCKNPAGSPGHSQPPHHGKLENCVGIWDVVGRTGPWFNPANLSANSANYHSFINNTFYEDAGTGSSTAIFNIDAASGDIGTVDCHSNLIWRNTTGGANSVEEFMSGGTTGLTKAGDLGWNVLIGGANVDGAELKTTGWYEVPWDAADDDGTAPDEQSTDVVRYEQADTVVFNDPDTTYAWELPNGLTTTILKDLRPLIDQYAGKEATTPGALPLVAWDLPFGGGSDPTDPNDPAAVPFVSVFPFYADVWRVSLNARLSTIRNRKRKHYLRRDTEGQAIREFASRRIQVAASSTKKIITGLETAEFVLLESDEPVQLNAGSSATVFLPEASAVLVAGGSYSALNVKNASATDAANTLIAVVD